MASPLPEFQKKNLMERKMHTIGSELSMSDLGDVSEMFGLQCKEALKLKRLDYGIQITLTRLRIAEL